MAPRRPRTSQVSEGRDLIPPGVGSPRILIVEDDEDGRCALRDVLASDGFTVREAKDGIEALEAITAQEPLHLILLDTWMPLMDGSQFLEWLRGHPELDRVPVVVLTADRVSIISDRALAVLRKPCDFGELLRIVRAVCGCDRGTGA